MLVLGAKVVDLLHNFIEEILEGLKHLLSLLKIMTMIGVHGSEEIRCTQHMYHLSFTEIGFRLTLNKLSR